MRIKSRFSSGLLNVTLAAVALSGCSLIPADPDRAAVQAQDAAAPATTAPGETALTAPSRLQATTVGIETAALPTVDPISLSELTPFPISEAFLPPDLIGRIRQGFALPQSEDPSIASELAWYASHPDYIERVFNRSSRYLHHIAEMLEARGMPADIALLPIVESAFDPFAYSRGRASGLWQIIPGTGDMLGLKQNWWYDGRRDVVDSTRAALDYLELLHEKFDGDWLLAIAGYNSGEGHIARAIAQAEREGRATDFWSLRPHLRSETSAYVPKLIAIRDLVSNPESHELELPVIANEPYFAAVETDGQIDIALAAELAGISVETLYELNPGINRWATDPDGPHRLLVPVELATEMNAALASLEPSERVRWTRHQISRGETLGEIAEDYETTPSVLRDINDLNGNIIRTGDHLMIPHASATAGRYSLSVDARTSRQQNRERDGNRIDYSVQAGDSLWSIAQRFDVGTEELASWNAMAPRDTLSVGRNLVVWTDDPLAASLASLRGPAQIRRINYVVRNGDSLAAIASRFRVTVSSLLDWNSLSADRYLQPGQALVLYVDVTEQST